MRRIQLPPSRATAPKAQNNGELPPHSEEVERGALSCVLQAGEENNQVEAEALLQQLRPLHFYLTQHASLLSALAEMRSGETPHPLNMLTVVGWLRQRKLLEGVGGERYLLELLAANPSGYSNFGYWLPQLQQLFYRRRLLSLNKQVEDLSRNPDVSLDDVHALFEDLTDKTSKFGEKRPALKIWRADELLKFNPPQHLRLVGDNEINMGYDGLALISGPGSSGKSLAVTTLALAGAIGPGATWMGRPVHRQFKTLILQAENGNVRLKDEMEALKRNHPRVDIAGHVFVSEPPEGGLPFHVPEFRRAVRREILSLGIHLVVLDTWAQVAADDSSKDVMDKLTEIRSCFPVGERCPGLLILAHTKKPRSEEVRKGRSLTYNISGSVALPNTSRCVYMLLPWTDELEEDRIYWACTKLNNGKMYPASVWHRKFGTFFENDPKTDPKTWGMEEGEDDDQKVKESDIVKAFGTETVLNKSVLARRLEEAGVCSYQTAMRVITPGKYGYLAHMVCKTPEGWIKLNDE